MLSPMSFSDYTLHRLPPPPLRVLEVGCGNQGGVTPALVATGHDVLAIDPRAPEGPNYRRITLEELEPERFDAVVAGRVLHHVTPLAPALAKLPSSEQEPCPRRARERSPDADPAHSERRARDRRQAKACRRVLDLGGRREPAAARPQRPRPFAFSHSTTRANRPGAYVSDRSISEVRPVLVSTSA